MDSNEEERRHTKFADEASRQRGACGRAWKGRQFRGKFGSNGEGDRAVAELTVGQRLRE